MPLDASPGVLVTISHCEVLVVSLFPSVELNFVVELVIVGVSFCSVRVGVGWGRHRYSHIHTVQEIHCVHFICMKALNFA